MKKNSILIGFLIFITFNSSVCKQHKDSFLRITDKSIPNIVNGIKYESGNWPHPNYAKPFKSLGNHRFVIEFKGKAEAVQVYIPWRRADENPDEKDLVIINAKSKERIDELLIQNVNNESGTFIFKPQNNSATYYVYYLPHESTGGYYPKVKYLSPAKPIDSTWHQKYIRLNAEKIKRLPSAKVVAAQSIDDFHTFFPMEIIATGDELYEMVEANPRPYYLFPEYRQYPIRMTDYLPKHWVDGGKKTGIYDQVKQGEFYTFQIAIYSPKTDLREITVSYTDLKSGNGNIIQKARIHSFNTSGIDLNGKSFNKNLIVKGGKVQPMWFGIDIPENISKGKYSGRIVIQPQGEEPEIIYIELDISEEKITSHGDDQPEKMSRLRWLDSKIGTDKNFIPRPFNPVEVENCSLKILGREIILGQDGFPEEIKSYFPMEMTYLRTKPEPILGAPVTFKILGKNRKLEKLKSRAYRIKQPYRSEVQWEVLNESENFYLKVQGSLEYDGTLSYKLKLSAKKNFSLDDIFLVVPMDPDAAELMVGLGRKGGKRPEKVSWKWNVKFHQEGVWLGNINKGLQYVLRDNNYERPLNTNFYQNKPLNLPNSWGNQGKGGIRIYKKGKVVVAENYSGERYIKKDEVLHFNIRFLITPFKTIDTKKHFSTRFIHKYVPVDLAEKWGGSVINVHHANLINPYINYPFYNITKQREYIEDSHKRGIKVKLYNTIRELSYKAHELFALKSLGDEIFNDGNGGGHSWLQEHLRSNYHSAWHATSVNDAAILNKGTSRWTNYYIEGINWLAKNQKIDGLYLDDIAFSRETVKRIVAVLSKHREEVIIDLHSANQFNPRDGFINSIFLYMEHLPYISRLWFGEYFDYNEDPDYWLTEVSGIPFGLTGEMLEKGGHPYRGMVFGMTTRVYGNYNPRALWKLFDDFDIKNSEMLGYWVKDSPIKVYAENILSTIYRHPDRVLIALGSWSSEDEKVRLNIDWKALGFNKNRVFLTSPAIEGLQEQKEYNPDLPVKIKKDRGLILILKNIIN